MSRSVPPAARNLGRLLTGLLLVLSASVFAGSSHPTDPANPPTAARSAPESSVPPGSSAHEPIAPPEPLSRNVTLRASTVAGRTLNYCSNGSLDRPAAEVTRVVFVIHGNDRQPCVVANAALAAATPAQRASTLVVAPRFPTAADRVDPVTHHYWTFLGWSQGDPSANADNPLSSYAVLDGLIDRVRHLPFVVAGFSGGGQFVARYAAGTAHEPVRFVITNPSSYLYWTGDRPRSSPALLASCPTYNDYRYGLNKLNPYMAESGPDVLARRFSERRVVYLLGDADNDPRSGSMDKTCGAMAQGAHRFERGQRYWAQLPAVFGPDVHQRHTRHVVRRVAHHPFRMFAAQPAKAALFS